MNSRKNEFHLEKTNPLKCPSDVFVQQHPPFGKTIFSLFLLDLMGLRTSVPLHSPHSHSGKQMARASMFTIKAKQREREGQAARIIYIGPTRGCL